MITLITILLMGAMLIATGVVLQKSGALAATSHGSPVADVLVYDDYNNNIGFIPYGTTYFDAFGSEGRIISYGWNFGDGAYEYRAEMVCEHAYTSCNWNGSTEPGDYYEPFHAPLIVTDYEFTTNTTYFDVTVYISGDANGDGIVNIMDATIVGLEWGSSCSPPWLCWRDIPDERADRADLNNDHEVNALDASIVGTEWMNTAWR